MRALLRLFMVSIDQYFIYRLNFILWRVRMVLGLLLTFSLWSTIFYQRKNAFGYSSQEMMTYVVLINVVGSIILASKTMDVASVILSGELMNYLLKPISYFKVLFTQEIADKVINVVCSFLEITVLVALIRPPFFIQTNIFSLIFFVCFVTIGVVIHFLISFGLSLIAFWTTETWAPRFIFWSLLSILSGSIFPLDVLPTAVYRLIMLTPFPYLTYIPLRTYLGMSLSTALPILFMGFLWIAVLFVAVFHFWKKGLHEFSFYGK